MASRIPSRIGTIRTAASAVDSDGLWKVTPNNAEGPARTWLVLTSDVATPAFPAGTLVLITKVLQLQSSPTVYPNQTPAGLARNNCQYRFKKLVITTRRLKLKSGAVVGRSVMSGMLSDRKLPENGAPLPPAPARMFLKDEKVYTLTDAVPEADHPRYGSYKVPPGTRVEIAHAGSRDGGKTVLASNSRHPTGARYVINVHLEVEERDWEECGFPAVHDGFRLPGVEEMAQIRKFNGPPADPRVVSF